MNSSDDIFKLISNKTKKNSRIIFRTVIGSPEENKKRTMELSNWFFVKDKTKSGTLPPSGSYLLQKKD